MRGITEVRAKYIWAGSVLFSEFLLLMSTLKGRKKQAANNMGPKRIPSPAHSSRNVLMDPPSVI